MTEIPEHLLKRAAARRAAMTGGDAAADAPAGDAPAAEAGAAATSASAAVAPKAKSRAPLPTLDSEPVAAPPDSPVVAAARSRKRVPFWAAPVLAMLPLWAFIYVYAVQPPPAGENDPLVIGAGVYAGKGGCAGCHGAQGEGGVGQKLNDGEVLATFANPLALTHWIAYGAEGGARPDGTYGDKDRPGGARNVNLLPGVMPGFEGSLTPEELAAVTIYVRQALSGGDPAQDEELSSETFEADPAAAEAQVEAVIETGEGGDPDLSQVPTPAG
ncbi:MAG: hypothetical protein JWM47_2921 [Acidimicrobiales bacterium]|nr:hypothetical protein [Acidimicrobiales bacterium]